MFHLISSANFLMHDRFESVVNTEVFTSSKLFLSILVYEYEECRMLKSSQAFTVSYILFYYIVSIYLTIQHDMCMHHNLEHCFHISDLST